jgi:outer membrane protein assembly factor BamB
MKAIPSAAWRRSLLMCVPIWMAAGLAQANDNWPQFRGSGGQGHSDSTGLALDWSESQNVAWKTAIDGQGWSSPVVLGSQIWLTTATDGGHSLHAICIDRKSGKTVHDVEVFRVGELPKIHATNSFASPTPALEPDNVYVHFGTFGTACLDPATGDIRWKNEQLKLDHQVGPGSSPVLYGDLLLLTCDGIDVQYAVALHKTNGQIAWKSPRTGVITKSSSEKKAFVTPLVIQNGGHDEAIMPGAEYCYAYEPLTGRELWQLHYPGYSNVPRPVFAHGLLYLATGYDDPEFWAIRPGGAGDITPTAVVWKMNKQAPTKPSAVVAGDEIYLLSDAGILSCLDALTGEQHWRHRLPGTFSASPVVADGRIYFCGEDGKTTVIAPGKQYQELASNTLDGRFMASPAVAGSAIFLRTDTHLYRIEAK